MLHVFLLLFVGCLAVLVLRQTNFGAQAAPTRQIVWWLVLIVLLVVFAILWTGGAVVVRSPA